MRCVIKDVIMKRYFFFAMLIFAVGFFTACSKTDNPILGKWNFSSQTSMTHYEENPQWDETQTRTDPIDYRNIKIFSNGKGKIEVRGIGIPEDPPYFVYEDFKWTQSGDGSTLNFVNDDWSIEWEVLVANESELQLQEKEIYGNTGSYRIVTYTFSR